MHIYPHTDSNATETFFLFGCIPNTSDSVDCQVYFIVCSSRNILGKLSCVSRMRHIIKTDGRGYMQRDRHWHIQIALTWQLFYTYSIVGLVCNITSIVNCTDIEYKLIRKDRVQLMACNR